MDEQNPVNRPVNPRRRKRSKMRIFKESYLPVIIAGAAFILVLVFIIGSISRSVENKHQEKEASIAASQEQAAKEAQLQNEASQLINQADALAKSYDYDGAIATLDTFSGNMNEYADLVSKRDQFILEKSRLVAWDDPGQIPNLSLQMLIADPNRAFHDDMFSYSFTRNFLTTEEFSRILEKLYSGGYVLVNMDDIITTATIETGAVVYDAKTLYLPSGKKPLLLTQTNVNYHTYLTDSNADKLPDSGGCGFASKLVFDENGEITCEYVDSSGQTLTGAYDMIPILNAFVEEHPDFSYQGAKAIIALTGYDGLFGYRTNSEAEANFGTAAYEASIESAKAIAKKLRDDGYELACYTFENKPYGTFSATQIQADLSGWTSEVISILGDVDIFVFAQNSDISDEGVYYTGEKYNILKNAGFNIFLGFCASGNPWAVITDSYVRQGRILLSPTNIAYHSDWFGFDTGSILDPSRGTIPT